MEELKNKSDEDFLNEKYKKYNTHWKEAEKNKNERIKKLKKKKKNISSDEEIEDIQSKKKNIEKIINQIYTEYNILIPYDIKKYLNNSFNKQVYNKLVREYHPDKNKYKREICELFTQLINEYRI